MGDKLFAIPWWWYRVDPGEKQLILTGDTAVGESAPGFDKDLWQKFADWTWGASGSRHSGSYPFWVCVGGFGPGTFRVPRAAAHPADASHLRV
jgi:hypothetical protein